MNKGYLPKRLLADLHKKYIQRTRPKAIVVDTRILLCHLTFAVRRGINSSGSSVYMSTRVLKHMYDKKTAEEYDFIIENLHKVVKYPDQIYRNRDGKRGNFCLLKVLGEQKYLCSIEDNNEKKR